MIVVQKYEPKPGDKGLAVKRGETVLLIRDSGDWLYVKNEKGEEGFVPRSHLLSPSATRTRTSSRSGMGLRQVASNGSVPMQRVDHSLIPPPPPPPPPSHHSQDDYMHSMSNGHTARLATEALYDQKYSPSSSSGVASLADPFSPGSNQSPTQDNENQVRSSNSSLNHSNESYSSYEQGFDQNTQPALISPLNHIKGESKAELVPNNKGLSHLSSSQVTTMTAPELHDLSRTENGTQENSHHIVDETTRHIYSTLEEPSSPPPPTRPPRRSPRR